MLRTLFAFLFLTVSISLCAQVGVNNSNPSQALDVNGKIQVSDDNTPAEKGTIRFNDATDEFEGYDGTEWKILSLEKSSGAPSDPIAYTGRTVNSVFRDSNGNVIPTDCRLYQTGNVQSGAPSNFITVPSGKHFLVTMLWVEDNGITNQANADDLYDVTISAPVSGSSTRFANSVRLVGRVGDSKFLIGDQTNPIIIMRPGDRFRIFNESSDTRVNINVRGFLVDELDF
ncbi:hypothetical protein [Lewinella sp. 4G2]|uniref:hypothetical protein n=1 Tax=Lewinella sp. 4G2 TaxID=1803372 RepID=UPI0007B4E046|nr:hypothetical protein [Lewinella sp. 4G2]OAV43154.1 hypothetical protein A3850_000985 [Lewinella sp. 4G2]